MQRLCNNRKLGKRSRLKNPAPFLNGDGIIRSRTRLQNARVLFNQKSPIILPARSHLAVTYVRHIHDANRSFLIPHLSANFQFIGGMSSMIKNIIQKCVVCRRHFYRPRPQQISDLPVERVTPRSPFQIIGIDFTGAFKTKCSYHRMVKYVKTYEAIFVCFSTRAVHIELIPSLST